MTSDERALMSAILADPTNDTPRLVYADWLEEQGCGERAEFIRDTVWMSANHTDCPVRLADLGRGRPVPLRCGICEYCTRRRRAEKFYSKHQWIDAPAYAVAFEPTPLDGEMPAGHGITLIVRRGFVAEVVCTLADWMGGECGECNGTGRRAYPNYQNGNPDWTCKKCYGGGVIPGYGPAIVAAQPVEVVRVTDMPIYPSSGNNTYYVGGLGRLPQKYWRQLEGLPSRQAAVAALSAALIAWAKEQKEQA